MTTSDNVSAIEATEKAMEGVTPGPWKRIAMGGSSTITSEVKPSRNDTRIPSYGYRDEEHCLAYPFIEDDGRARWDFVCFSHADAAYIAACSPERMRSVLSAARKVEAMEREIAELRKALTDASDAISAFADSVFNDNGDMTVNLGLATGDDYIRAYFADRRARALLSKESAEQDGSASDTSGTSKTWGEWEREQQKPEGGR